LPRSGRDFFISQPNRANHRADAMRIHKRRKPYAADWKSRDVNFMSDLSRQSIQRPHFRHAICFTDHRGAMHQRANIRRIPTAQHSIQPANNN
jgi:hypothetical protein